MRSHHVQTHTSLYEEVMSEDRTRAVHYHNNKEFNVPTSQGTRKTRQKNHTSIQKLIIVHTQNTLSLRDHTLIDLSSTSLTDHKESQLLDPDCQRPREVETEKKTPPRK